MITAIIRINEQTNKTLNIIKALYGLSTKDEAINKAVELLCKYDKKLNGMEERK